MEKEQAPSDKSKENEQEQEQEQEEPQEHVHLTFPQRLMEVLENPEYARIISWLDNGNDFIFHDVDAFCRIILPKYFRKTCLFTSFKRKLNRWGFRTRDRGKETRIYHHPLFHRGGYNQLHQMSQSTSTPSTSKQQQQQHPPKNAPQFPETYHGHSQQLQQLATHPLVHTNYAAGLSGIASLLGSNVAATTATTASTAAESLASLLQTTTPRNDLSSLATTTHRPQPQGASMVTSAASANSHSDIARLIQQDSNLSAYFWGVFWEEYQKQLPMQQQQQQQLQQQQIYQRLLQQEHNNAETLSAQQLASLLMASQHDQSFGVTTATTRSASSGAGLSSPANTTGTTSLLSSNQTAHATARTFPPTAQHNALSPGSSTNEQERKESAVWTSLKDQSGRSYLADSESLRNEDDSPPRKRACVDLASNQNEIPTISRVSSVASNSVSTNRYQHNNKKGSESSSEPETKQSNTVWGRGDDLE